MWHKDATHATNPLQLPALHIELGASHALEEEVLGDPDAEPDCAKKYVLRECKWMICEARGMLSVAPASLHEASNATVA